jgi:hypothetical protein
VFDDGASSGSTDGDDTRSRCRWDRAGTAKRTRSRPSPTRTAKEGLGGKASDEQRVDNCEVPPAVRGPKPRPDECGDAARTRSYK